MPPRSGYTPTLPFLKFVARCRYFGDGLPFSQLLKTIMMHHFLLRTILLGCLCGFFLIGNAQKGSIYELRRYDMKTDNQVRTVDKFLEQGLLPSLHDAGIKQVGVFHPIANDTAQTKHIYVLIPYKNWKQYQKIQARMATNAYGAGAADYLNAAYNTPPYQRIQTTLMEAFKFQPRISKPDLKSPTAERVYELRSYEGPTDKLYRAKVHMFNEGGEMEIFDRLNFNPVFYGDVIAGCTMPNLMYMTSFENMEDRNAHWDAFRTDAGWAAIKDLPQYANTVSKNTITLMRATPYSDL